MGVDERRAGDRRRSRIEPGADWRRYSGIESQPLQVQRSFALRKRVEAGLRTLAETSAVIFHSRNSDDALRNVATAVARTFATCCVIYAYDTGGRLQRVAAVHSDPAINAALQTKAPSLVTTGAHPLARALRGEAAITEDVALQDGLLPTVLGSTAPEVAGFAASTMITAPIIGEAGPGIIGVLTCIMDATDPLGDFTQDDMRFAVEIALRAGLAFDHVRDFTRDRLIAVTLQEATLPKHLPQIDSIRVSADFRAGSSEATIGGDWYDAFPLEDGRVAVTIGDVFGSGLHAAVTMGKIRQSMRAFASFVPFPNAMLDVADRVVREERPDTYATALAGIFNPATEEFTFASAGHHAPILRHPDGLIEEIVSPGVLLGLRPRGEQNTMTAPMRPGSAIFFFTDGLIEVLRDIDEGRRRIDDAIAVLHEQNVENTAKAFVDLVLRGQAVTDDVAALVAEVALSKEHNEPPQSEKPDRYLRREAAAPVGDSE